MTEDMNVERFKDGLYFLSTSCKSFAGGNELELTLDDWKALYEAAYPGSLQIPGPHEKFEIEVGNAVFKVRLAV